MWPDQEKRDLDGLRRMEVVWRFPAGSDWYLDLERAALVVRPRPAGEDTG
jgi:hypothetical protein